MSIKAQSAIDEALATERLRVLRAAYDAKSYQEHILVRTLLEVYPDLTVPAWRDLKTRFESGVTINPATVSDKPEVRTCRCAECDDQNCTGKCEPCNDHDFCRQCHPDPQALGHNCRGCTDEHGAHDCCGYCSECDQHIPNVDRNEETYCRHCNHCAECEHYCVDD